MVIPDFDWRLVPKQNYAACMNYTGCLCLGPDLLDKHDDGIEQKLMKTHRANLVHDCVEVIEFYDRNVFNKHWLMQKLSQFYVLRSLI